MLRRAGEARPPDHDYADYACCRKLTNYGELYRQGETVSTAFVESTINQVVSRRFVKLQQMHWTLRGAHLLLQTRTKVQTTNWKKCFGDGTRCSGFKLELRAPWLAAALLFPVATKQCSISAAYTEQMIDETLSLLAEAITQPASLPAFNHQTRRPATWTFLGLRIVEVISPKLELVGLRFGVPNPDRLSVLKVSNRTWKYFRSEK